MGDGVTEGPVADLVSRKLIAGEPLGSYDHMVLLTAACRGFTHYVRREGLSHGFTT